MIFQALIVDRDLNSRSRLKQAAHHSGGFNHVHTTNTLGECLAKLKLLPYDVVFVAADFPADELPEFIESAKASPGGADCAYILVFRSQQDAMNTAASIVHGLDGFLFEPFSVNMLLEITKIAHKVKEQNAKRRLKAASELILSDAAHEIDARAEGIARGEEAVPVKKRLRATVEQFKNIAGDSLLEMIEDVMEKVTAKSRPILRSGYKGPSKRVKQMLDEKVLHEQADNSKKIHT